jgi:hypothetical protein
MSFSATIVLLPNCASWTRRRCGGADDVLHLDEVRVLGGFLLIDVEGGTGKVVSYGRRVPSPRDASSAGVDDV